MRPLFVISIAWLFVFNSISPLFAGELAKISRVKTKDIIQLYFRFDRPPTFSSKGDKKRIDIIFNDSESNSSLELFDPDEDIVKILSRQVDDKLIFTFYYRYQPQSHKVTRSADGTIVFEVLLGNQYSKSYQDLADRLKGLTVVDRTTPDFTNPYTITPYVRDWKSFFKDYESPVFFELPVKFTLPPFPIIALLPPNGQKNLQLLTKEQLLLAADGLWDQLATSILKTIETTGDITVQKLLALCYGEILLRIGDFEGAYKQLYLLKEKYKDEFLGTYSEYLLVLLRAINEDPYLAEYELRKIEDAISNHSLLAPYFYLSQIETALASKEYRRLNTLLQRDDIALPPEIEERVKIRQADYWFAIKQSIKAFASYKLLENSSLILTQPYSYNGYCSTLYDQKKFPLAAKGYKKLATLALDKDNLGFISYRENMSRLKYENKNLLLDEFSLIENVFAGKDSGFLAGLKKNDLLLLRDVSWAESAIKNYELIAEEASNREIRGEALFKITLLHSLSGKQELAIQRLMKLLRQFQTGSIRIPAQALLIDLLPTEIKQMVDKKRYMDALVLAKQNRNLFQNNWLDSKFLVDIARAYHKIGIFNEAQKLYLYLLEITPVEQREDFFLPMIQATFDFGNFTLVEDYAAQYTYNYPNGQYSDEILYLRLLALISDERLQDAFALLPATLPESKDIISLAALLHFRLGNHSETVEIYQELQQQNELSQQQQFIYAESLYNSSQYIQAEKEYLKIEEINPFYDQSLYRLAQLARRKGDDTRAFELFRILIDKGKNQRWIQYAERELQYNEIKDRY